MNLPNQLTLLRLVLTGVFVALLSVEFPWSHTLALLVFAVAAITDFFDGHIARKRDLVTNFGKLMDPLADKVLMCAGFVLLTALHLIPAWVVVLILTREFLVTGLRLIALAENVVLAAEKLGKHKTTWQIITIVYFLVYLASTEPMFAWIAPLFEWKITGLAVTGQILIWVTMALTLWSGVSYLSKNRGLLKDC